MNSELLSHAELSELLDMIQSLVFCQDMDHFVPVARRLEGLTGCEHVIFGLPELLDNREMAVADLNVSYPQEWVDLYQANEFWRIDPVVLRSLVENGPLCWADVYRRYPTDKEFMKLAHDFLGYKDGYTCLTRPIAGGDWTIVSLAGDFKKQDSRLDYILDRMAPHFHLACMSIRMRDGASKLVTPSRREKEVLKWLQQGKTSWEISIILNVSEATINFHIKNIKKKLNAVSRSQAVATAIHCGLISL